MRLMLRLVGAAISVALMATLISDAVVGLAPRTGQVRVAQELTGSMRPTIAVGGLIIYRSVTANQLKRRDVISFRRAGYTTTVTHRIVSIFRSGRMLTVVTRGDANNADDSPPITFQADQKVWRTAVVLPTWLGSPIFALARHGMVFVLSLLPLNLLLPWLRRQFDEDRAVPRRRRRLPRLRGAD